MERIMKVLIPILAFIAGGYYSLSTLGVGLVGYGESSYIQVILDAIIPCFIGGLIFGILNARYWWMSASIGSIPPLMLFLLMFQGIVIEGHINEAYWFCIPIGIIAGFFLFGFIGAKLFKIIKR
jgi:hypothetical protein